MSSSREKCRDIHWPFANYITNKGQMDPLKGDALNKTLQDTTHALNKTLYEICVDKNDILLQYSIHVLC